MKLVQAAFARGTSVLILLASLAACRNDITVNGQSVKGNLKVLDEKGPAAAAVDPTPTDAPPSSTDNPPTATVIDIPDGLLTGRSYVQSRTPITLTISPDVANLGDTFSLYNDSTGQTLVAQQGIALYDPLDAGQSLAPALWSEAGAALAPYDLTLRLYPLDPEFSAKLTYGANQLRLMVREGSASPKRSERVLQRRDFTMTGVARSFSKEGMQRRNGFEAELGLWHQPVVSTDKSTLTLGVIPLLSR